MIRNISNISLSLFLYLLLAVLEFSSSVLRAELVPFISVISLTIPQLYLSGTSDCWHFLQHLPDSTKT
jgi:hypothetical protein